ncbi:MAG: hypothetical protein SGJ27_07425 [Candidatus Melainabacteria bacterium]|nr:hypothetical protein [Candidatus Melainabacteria bacterium]
MIRLGKPVKLLEWGVGTNTTNQRWIEFGSGNIVGKPKTVDGITTIIVKLDKGAEKSNSADDTIKVAQCGESMTPLDDKAWGEVAYGRLKSIEGDTVEVEVKVAVKVGR